MVSVTRASTTGRLILYLLGTGNPEVDPTETHVPRYRLHSQWASSIDIPPSYMMEICIYIRNDVVGIGNGSTPCSSVKESKRRLQEDRCRTIRFASWSRLSCMKSKRPGTQSLFSSSLAWSTPILTMSCYVEHLVQCRGRCRKVWFRKEDFMREESLIVKRLRLNLGSSLFDQITATA